MEDAELLAAWGEGDTSAADQLIRKHFAAVQRFFRNKAWGDCEDLTQTTFERCVAGRDRFEGRSSFRTYLFSVARYVLFEHYRSKKAGAFDPAHSSVIDIDASPSQIVAGMQWQQSFVNLLREIPVEMQVVLELYYWEGLRTHEIAEIVEVPRGTVKSRLHHARLQLRKRCEEHGLDIGQPVSLPGWARDLEFAA